MSTTPCAGSAGGQPSQPTSVDPAMAYRTKLLNPIGAPLASR
jgi:hypothetical protein